MNCDAPASEIIVRCWYCLQRGIYEECTDGAASDECKKEWGENCEKDGYEYPDACEPWYLSSIHYDRPAL